MDGRTKTWFGGAAGLICVTFLIAWSVLHALSTGVGDHGRVTELYLKTVHEKGPDLEAAELGLGLLGTNAMPTITNMLCFRDSWWRTELRALLKSQSVVGVKIHTEFEIQYMAVEGIKRVGNLAGPYLVRLFRDAPLQYAPENPGYRALKALIALQAGSVPALDAGLTNANANVRAHSALAIANSFHLRDPVQITNLVTCMADLNSDVRAAAAFAVGKVMEAPELSVAALAKGLSDTNSAVRFHSIHSLWAFGVHARDVMPQIEEAIKRERELPDAGSDQWELGPKSKEMILYAMTNALETIRDHVETPN